MKTIFFIIILLFSIPVFSQEKYTTYHSIYGNSKYEIKIYNEKGSDDYKLYIDMYSLDRLRKGGIVVDKKTHESLISTLLESQIKYNEWLKTTKENNVVDIVKTMAFKTKVRSGYFETYRSWAFDYDVVLSYTFYCKNELNLLIVRTGIMNSSTNEYIDHDGVLLVFTSNSDINDFLNILSKDKVYDFISKPKNIDLLKD